MPSSWSTSTRRPRPWSARTSDRANQEFLGSAFAEIMAVLDEQDLTPAGPPFGRWQPRADGSTP